MKFKEVNADEQCLTRLNSGLRMCIMQLSMNPWRHIIRYAKTYSRCSKSDLDAAGESVEFYADDSIYFEENTNDGYTGSLEMALIPDEFRVDVLGDEIDSNGALIENRDAKVKKFALMFEFDGDAKKMRHVLYYVLASRPSVSGSTRTNTKEPQTETMNITARPAPDTGDVKAKVPQDSTVYDTFF